MRRLVTPLYVAAVLGLAAPVASCARPDDVAMIASTPLEAGAN